MSETDATPLGISASDSLGVVLGGCRSGKSTLCNRLCTTIDFPRDKREVADVLVSTREPCLYTLKNSQHNKILDTSSYRSHDFPDDDMASFATKNHLHRADYVIMVYCLRAPPPEEMISWCIDNEKPAIVVCDWTYDEKLMMREENCSQSEVRTEVREQTRDITKDEDVAPCFAVNTEQWQTAIKAYEAGNYDAAQLHYDEGELLKFVARVGQVKSTPGGSVSDFFQSYELGLRCKSESFGTTQLDKVLLDVHYYSRNRFDRSSSGAVSSVKTQTVLPPTASSRAVRLAPTFFQ